MKISVKSNADAVAAEFRLSAKEAAPATARALNRVVEMARTQTSRGLREDGYNFSAAEIKQAIDLMKATSASLITTMKVKRRTKSLMNFDPKESKAGVSVKVRGGRKLIKGAFIAQRLNGLAGVFIEDKRAGKIVMRRSAQYKKGSKGGWQSYPARKLYGPSVGGAFVNERFLAVLRQFVDAKFHERMTHEVRRMLKIK